MFCSSQNVISSPAEIVEQVRLPASASTLVLGVCSFSPDLLLIDFVYFGITPFRDLNFYRLPFSIFLILYPLCRDARIGLFGQVFTLTDVLQLNLAPVVRIVGIYKSEFCAECLP